MTDTNAAVVDNKVSFMKNLFMLLDAKQKNMYSLSQSSLVIWTKEKQEIRVSKCGWGKEGHRPVIQIKLEAPIYVSLRPIVYAVDLKDSSVNVSKIHDRVVLRENEIASQKIGHLKELEITSKTKKTLKGTLDEIGIKSTGSDSEWSRNVDVSIEGKTIHIFCNENETIDFTISISIGVGRSKALLEKLRQLIQIESGRI